MWYVRKHEAVTFLNPLALTCVHFYLPGGVDNSWNTGFPLLDPAASCLRGLQMTNAARFQSFHSILYWVSELVDE